MTDIYSVVGHMPIRFEMVVFGLFRTWGYAVLCVPFSALFFYCKVGPARYPLIIISLCELS